MMDRDTQHVVDSSVVELLSRGAEHRGGRDGRRADGAFFTDADVAQRLVRRAICARLLDAVGASPELIDDALSSGADMHELIVARSEDDEARRDMVCCLRGLRVLDPTCGAGSFLAAAWAELVAVARVLEVDATVVSPGQLHGVDIDPDAVAACRSVLEIVARGSSGGQPQLRVGDVASSGQLPESDIVVGNPPFIRASAPDSVLGLETASVPNVSAWIVERALAAAAPRARCAFVLPISTACTDAFGPARSSWSRRCDRIHSSHFDTIPSSLFAGVVQRITIFEGRARCEPGSPASWHTTRYHRWRSSERAGLLESVRFVPMPSITVNGSIAKIGTTLEAELLEVIFRHPPARRLHHDRRAGVPDPMRSGRLLYKRRWSYFLLFSTFEPPIWNEDGTARSASELQELWLAPGIDANVMLAIYSSTLFWWYFSVFTDNRNVNRRDLTAFPVPDLTAATLDRLTRLGDELSDALRACGEVRTCTYRSVGTIHNTYYKQGATRPVLDRIDAELATVYGMSPAQLQHVVEFERRFRS